MKLSRNQEEVIRLMKDGWELASHHGISSWSTIQKNGIGMGGESKRVSIATIGALVDKGFIERNNDKKDWRSTFYKLKEV